MANSIYDNCFKQLKEYFTESPYLVFGGAALYKYGLRECFSDIDIFASEKCWMYLKTTYENALIASGKQEKIVLADGSIEVFNKWGPGRWDFEDVYSRSEVIDGIRFASIFDLLKWKIIRYESSMQEKDLRDIDAIEKYITSPQSCNNAYTYNSI